MYDYMLTQVYFQVK